MPGGTNHAPKRQRRRLSTATLTLGGLCLIGGAAYVAAMPPREAQLDRAAQMERVLPVPANPEPAGDSPRSRVARPALPAAVVKPKPAAPAPRVWKQMPRPTRIVIPAIGASAPMISLGHNPDGSAEVPKGSSKAGWFEPGPEPGEQGSAVILGHVDSYQGPGVFYRLPALRRGDRIKIVLANGKTLQFAVTGTMQAPKNRFPTKLVFKKTPGATLRLVTCGGPFNRSTGHYVDNYIVFAWLIGRP